MNHSTKCQSISPRCRHIVDFDIWISFGHAAAPQFQCFSSTSFTHFLRGCCFFVCIKREIEKKTNLKSIKHHLHIHITCVYLYRRASSSLLVTTKQYTHHRTAAKSIKSYTHALNVLY